MSFAPGPLTEPLDLINLGHKCVDCGGRRVVYYISAPAVEFPQGAYCYKCLLARVGATKQRNADPRLIDRVRYKIPSPMPLPLFIRLKVDLGLEKASDNPYF